MVGDHTGILGAVVLSVFLAWWCGSVVLNHILEVHLVATISRRRLVVIESVATHFGLPIV
jgi:predicted anti-sigma-YlaC factor YlaD